MPLPWSCKFPLSIIPISFFSKKVASGTFDDVMLQYMYNFQGLLFLSFSPQISSSKLNPSTPESGLKKFQIETQKNRNGKKIENKIITCCCIKYFETSRFVLISPLDNWWLFLRKVTYLPILEQLLFQTPIPTLLEN